MVPLADQLAALARETGGSLLVTTSRRTGADNIGILERRLGGSPHILWTGAGENPYYAFLGSADAILVTADSVNMTSEACTTGKPVHVISLEGAGGKFARFHAALQEDGLTRPFKGRLEAWSYAPLDDVQIVADRVRAMIKAKTND
jgi:mitochondrial fission protein ELM1